MATRFARRYYFLAPSDNIAPETTIKLGQLIPDPRRPDVGIAEPYYILESQLNPPNVIQPWRWRHRHGSTADLSLSAGILSVFFGAGPELDFGRSSSEALEFAATSLETISFNPDKEYVKASLSDAAVLNYLDQHRSASLYMVTGVKIVRNLSVRRVGLRNWSGQLGASLDGTATGVPVQGVGSLGVGTVSTTDEEYGRAGDIVLAVKINKVLLYWGRATGRTKEMLRGTVLDTESRGRLGVETVSEDEDAEVVLDIELLDEGASGQDVERTWSMISKLRKEDDGNGECVLLAVRQRS